MTTNVELGPQEKALLQRLTELPFIHEAASTAVAPRFDDRDFDALVRIETDAGVFEFVTEIKRSYLDLSITRAVIAAANRLLRQEKKRFLLFARYIPRPTGERLIDAGVNFMDSTGNIHIDLEPHYHWTVLGRQERKRDKETPSETAATLQVLFTLVAKPESAGWTVRELASVAGVSKSKAASARRQIEREGTLRKLDGEYRPVDREAVTDRLLSGYRRVLRPHLVIGRFRPPEQEPTRFLEKLAVASQGTQVRYALTGGPAVFELLGFYRGPNAPLFIDGVNRDVLKEFRLLPDQRGPVTLLRAFGDLVFWQVRGNVPLADPWLIYAELLSDSHPRAHEAADQLRRELLSR